MGLFSIFVPGILATSIYLTGLSTSGVNHNVAVAKARTFQQFFIRNINASSDNTRVQNDGNKVLLELYNKSLGTWETAALCYLPEEKKIVFFPPSPEGPSSNLNSLVTHAHQNGKKPVFEAEQIDGINGVRCNLFIGKSPPDKKDKVAGLFVTPGVFLNLSATPRNKGPEQ